MKMLHDLEIISYFIATHELKSTGGSSLMKDLAIKLSLTQPSTVNRPLQPLTSGSLMGISIYNQYFKK